MSWHFSMALMRNFENSRSSRALVEAFSEATCSDGEPSAPSSGSPTPLLFCAPDRMTAFSRLSRFGMTFEPLTADRGAALLTWFRAGFPARTSASPARAPASTASGPGCGRTWHGSSARFDRATSSWRTLQQSLLGDSDECSVTWPRSGMTADGLCWELPMLGRRISGIGSGLWPTPVASDTSSRSKPYAQGGTPLSLAAKMWPTPTVCGNYNKAGLTPKSGDGLATAVKMWATPVRRDYRHPGRSRLERTGGTQGECLPQQVGGALNPTWVEWLMYWPTGWASLEPMNEREFQYWKAASAAPCGCDQLREMWFNREAGAPSQGWQPDEQRAEQSGGAVFAMPSQRALENCSCDLRSVRADVPAEESEASDAVRVFELQQRARQEIGRTAVGVTARVDRLKAIGNGQVPAVAALAWHLLTGGSR
jgi:hypothetical protein